MAATIFQAFRVLFGLIIAGFVVYFFLSYAGVYGGTEETKIKTDIVKNFASALNDVYETNVPISFTQFGDSQFDFDVFLDTDYSPTVHYPMIVESSIIIDRIIYMPLILLSGERIQQ
jgi:hypothetical protein